LLCYREKTFCKKSGVKWTDGIFLEKDFNALNKSDIAVLTQLKNFEDDSTAFVVAQGVKGSSSLLIPIAILLPGILIAIAYSIAKTSSHTHRNGMQPVRDTQNNPNDILKRINIEHAWHQSNVGLRIIDKDFRVIFQNKQFEKLTSISVGKQDNPLC